MSKRDRGGSTPSFFKRVKKFIRSGGRGQPFAGGDERDELEVGVEPSIAVELLAAAPVEVPAVVPVELAASSTSSVNLVEDESLTLSSVGSVLESCQSPGYSDSNSVQRAYWNTSKSDFEATGPSPLIACVDSGIPAVSPLISTTTPDVTVVPVSSTDLCPFTEEIGQIAVEPLLYENVLKHCYEPIPVDELESADTEATEWSPAKLSDPAVDVEIHDSDQGQHFCEMVMAANGSHLLYENATITVMETLIATLTLVLTENLDGSTFGALLKYASLLIPKPNLFFSSPYLFYQTLETHDSSVQLYFYCTTCFKIRKSIRDVCDTCISPHKSVNYFIHFPIRPQLQRLFQRSKFVEGLKYKESVDNIEDIYDSEAYKRFDNDPRFNGKTKISLGWNQDGISPFNCSNYSLTPFYLVINELPPGERFKKENVILGGLWGGRKSPIPMCF